MVAFPKTHKCQVHLHSVPPRSLQHKKEKARRWTCPLLVLMSMHPFAFEGDSESNNHLLLSVPEPDLLNSLINSLDSRMAALLSASPTIFKNYRENWIKLKCSWNKITAQMLEAMNKICGVECRWISHLEQTLKCKVLIVFRLWNAMFRYTA